MDKKILKTTTEIKKCLDKKWKSLEIDKKRFIVENDESIKQINGKINELLKNIEVLQSFCSFETPEIKENYKEIYKLKQELLKNEKMINYNNALKEYNIYVDYINNQIFNK